MSNKTKKHISASAALRNLGGAQCTLQEVADEFHITRERARQIEQEALRKLRVRLERDHPELIEFLDNKENHFNGVFEIPFLDLQDASAHLAIEGDDGHYYYSNGEEVDFEMSIEERQFMDGLSCQEPHEDPIY